MMDGCSCGRVWAMPNRRTFSIRPIRRFIDRYRNGGLWLDPFANESRLATEHNDLNPEYGCEWNLDALDFLGRFNDASAYGVLLDPPYSVRQVAECYKDVGVEYGAEATRSDWYSNLRDAAARAVRPGGYVLSFGWNSNGLGKGRGFYLAEVLNVAHGGAHNDTICIAEKLVQTSLECD